MFLLFFGSAKCKFSFWARCAVNICNANFELASLLPPGVFHYPSLVFTAVGCKKLRRNDWELDVCRHIKWPFLHKRWPDVIELFCGVTRLLAFKQVGDSLGYQQNQRAREAVTSALIAMTTLGECSYVACRCYTHFSWANWSVYVTSFFTSSVMRCALCRTTSV